MQPDIVLLDDDEQVCSHWKRRCNQAKRTIRTFRYRRDLWMAINEIHRTATLFIDKNLQGKTTGIAISKYFFKNGFQNIFLSTAEDPKNQPHMPWIRGIVGKTPPPWLFDTDFAKPLARDERDLMLTNMSSAQLAVYKARMEHFLMVAHGQPSGALPGPDFTGFNLPEAVLNAWERGITQSFSDEQIRLSIEDAWKLH